MPSESGRLDSQEVRRLQEQILSLETEIEALEQDNNTLAVKVNSYAAQAQKLINENRQLTLKSKNIVVHNPYEEDLKQCRLTIDKQNKEIAILKSTLVSSSPPKVDDDNLEELENRIAEQRSVFEAEISELRAENQMLSKVASEVDAFENELLMKSKLHETLQQRIDQLENENECLKDEIAERADPSIEDVEVLKSQLKTKDFERSHLETELQEAKTALAASELALEELKDDMKNAEASKVSDLESQVFMLKTELEEKQEQLQLMQGDQNEMNLSVQKKLEETMQRLVTLEKLKESAEMESKEMMSTCAQLKSENENLTARVDAAEEARSAAQKQCSILEAEKCALQEQMSKATETEGAKREELQSLQKEFEEKNAALTVKLESANTARTAAEEKCTSLEAEIAALQEQVSRGTEAEGAKVVDLQRLQKELEEKSKVHVETIAQLEEKNAALSAELESLNTTKSESEKRCIAMEAEIATLQQIAEAAITEGEKVAELESRSKEADLELMNIQKVLETNSTMYLGEVSLLEEQKAMLSKELESSNIAKNAAEERCVSLEAENITLQQVVKAAYDEAQSELITIQQELATKSKMHAKEKSNLEEGKAALSAELQTMVQTVQELLQAQSEAEEKCSAMESEINALHQQIAKTAENEANKGEALEILESKFKEADLKLTKTEKELEMKSAAFLKEKSQMKERNSALSSELDTVKTQLSEQASLMEQMKQENAGLRLQNQTAISEMEQTLEKNSETAFVEIERLNEANAKQNKKLKKLKADLKTRSEAVLALGKEVDNAQSKLESANQQITELQEANSSLVAENSSLSSERTDLLSEVSQLEEKLKALDLEKGKRILESENTNLKKKNQRLVEDLQRRESTNKDLEQQVLELKRVHSGDDSTLHTPV